MKDAAEFGAVLDAIASRAAALRAAGVRKIQVDGIHVEIAAPAVAAPVMSTESAPASTSVAEDPATYGLRPGAKLPGIDWGPLADDLAEKQAQRDRDLGTKRRA